MSWQDRAYAGDEDSRPVMRIGFRRPSSAVAALIIANVVIFFADAIASNAHVDFHQWCGLNLDGISHLYVWQLVTYMFLHANVMHLFFNMLGLYVFGSEYEKAFGRERFLQFYFFCGLLGGLAYVVLGLFEPQFRYVPLIGASGAIYGLLVAAIIFFPSIQVILFLFPVPIRVFGLIIAGVLFLQLVSHEGLPNKGGEVCHLAGAAAAVALTYAWGMMPRFRVEFPGRRASSRGEGAWSKRQQELAREQEEVDRILAKVSEQGLQSLNRKERKTLELATRHQRERERELRHIDRT